MKIEVALGLSLLASVAAAAPRLAYEGVDGTVWVADADGTHARKLAKGADPEISPDGKQLAFNTDEGPADKPPVRHIAVADVATGKVTVFKTLPSDNCFGPTWSPDGKQLLFYILLENEWALGLVNADGTGYRRFPAPEGVGARPLWSAAWAPNGLIYGQDLESVYRVDLDGVMHARWDLKGLLKDEVDLNSNARFSVSPDGATLLLDADLAREHDRKDWDGPAPAIYAVDLSTGRARKVGPDFCWEPRWAGADTILFISQGTREKAPSIYRMAPDGTGRTLVVKNGRHPSLSR
jgi:TolB protein